jgi:TolB-like protein/Flp pilus assembly protein TadD
MPDIFLSYTREDQATAQRFAEAFEAQGLSVWWDVTLRSGEAYDQVTEEALRSAKAVVVLWSQKSVISRWVRAEATMADRHRTLIPAMIEPCERPIMFELTQTADLSRWTGAATDPAWRAFLADVRRFVEAGAAPQKPPPVRLPQTVPPQPHGAGPSLAVLPFINRSGREDDGFADGMADDLTTALSGSRWMKVVAASATAFYRTGARDLQQIGRDLRARYLLEGNVRRAGDVLRVTAQLIEAETGGVLWARRFDRALSELSDLQDDLVTDVAAHLSVQVQRAETEHALNTPCDSAYDAMMRAIAYVAGSGPSQSNWQAAVTELERAVELDPNNGAALGLLATYRSRLFRYHDVGAPDVAQKIYDEIRRARALDPNDTRVLSSSAAALAMLGRLQDALPLAERSVRLNPSYEPARFVLGGVLLRLGRTEEAIFELDQAERLGPDGRYAQNSAVYRSVAHLRAGRLDQALDDAERSLRLFPSSDALIQNMLCQANAGSWDRARDALRRAQDTDPEMSLGSIANQIRDLYMGSASVEDHVAIARRVWDETEGEPGSA